MIGRRTGRVGALVLLGVVATLGEVVRAEAVHRGIMDLELGEPQPQPGMPGLPFAAAADSTVGWSFHADVPIRVTSLGFFDEWMDGLNWPHLVGLWDEDRSLVASARVERGTEHALVGQYRHVPIEPITLEADCTYTLGATVPLWSPYTLPVEPPIPSPPADMYPFYDVVLGSVTVGPGIEVECFALRYVSGAGPGMVEAPGVLHYPDVASPGGHFLAPNMQYEIVPEPTAALFLTAGVLSLARRRRGQRGRGLATSNGARRCFP